MTVFGIFDFVLNQVHSFFDVSPCILIHWISHNNQYTLVVCEIQWIKMRGQTAKFVGAQQAKPYIYKNMWK